MKQRIHDLLQAALIQLQAQGKVPVDFAPQILVERCRDRAHGDWATNLAMISAKVAGLRPRDMAEQIVSALPHDTSVQKIDIAGPGFINITVDEQSELAALPIILQQGERFGHSQRGAGQLLQVEFVSANPTSSLHVGHGRGAAYGMTVANLLESQGYRVDREYYVNDAGRQMDILATSTFLRYLELCGELLAFPSNGYRGDYVMDMARVIQTQHGDIFRHSSAEIFAGAAIDEQRDAQGEIVGGDKEAHIDDLIAAARRSLGTSSYGVFFSTALDTILDDIRDDLAEFGVSFKRWYSEKSLVDSGALPRALERLQQAGATYTQGGALWFRSTNYGDDKDRVLVRDNGQTTYFASDVAYHLDKFERGYQHVINIWGADHHGYIVRVTAALQALGIDPSRLEVRLVQFVSLWRGSEQVPMSSRSGQFITLRELRQEVGNDAARFYYITRKSEQHIDFDLQLATSQSKDNPVYYIQYAHARVCSVRKRLTELGYSFDACSVDLSALNTDAEHELAQFLLNFPEVVNRATEDREPHQLANYLREAAAAFHAWYNGTKVLVDDPYLRQARFMLCECVAQVLHNGLTLLGVSAPQHM
ncbi:MAG: arginine--tRNA ligase [Pseudomonadales bacterium]|nr:arginine--tRNA ligase [Pseudomonadales bacterium]